MTMTLETDTMHIVLAPERGGKVTEIFDRRAGRNLLLSEMPTAGLPLPDGTTFDVAGWDEAIPTVEASAGAPELGDAWRTPAACRVEEDCLHAHWVMPGWELAREIAVVGREMAVRYIATNRLDTPAPLLWAGHVLLPLAGLHEAGLPAGTPQPGPECHLNELAARLDGDDTGWYIHHVTARNQSWKFFLPAAQPVTLRYADVTLTLTTDAGWWGIWLNEGKLCNLHCLGIEPTNAPTDALADVRDRVPAGGAFTASWHLQIT